VRIKYLEKKYNSFIALRWLILRMGKWLCRFDFKACKGCCIAFVKPILKIIVEPEMEPMVEFCSCVYNWVNGVSGGSCGESMLEPMA